MTVCFSFSNLGKAFNRLPRDVTLLVSMKLYVEERLVRIVRIMCRNNRFRVNGCFSNDFQVQVGLQKCSESSVICAGTII